MTEMASTSDNSNTSTINEQENEESQTRSNYVDGVQGFIDKSRDVYQRTAWNKLHVSICYLVYKVNAVNIGTVKKELLRQNMKRGKHIFCKYVIKGLLTPFVDIRTNATLVATINLVLPDIGKLVLKKCLMQLKKSYYESVLSECVRCVMFIGHLINHGVASEHLVLELFTLFFIKRDMFTFKMATELLEMCGKKLNQVSQPIVNLLFIHMGYLLNDEQLDSLVKDEMKLMMELHENGFKFQLFDLLPGYDSQITHSSTLISILNTASNMIGYRYEPEFELNEKNYKNSIVISQGYDNEKEERELESVTDYNNQYDGEKKFVEIMEYIDGIENDTNMLSLRKICARKMINELKTDYSKLANQIIKHLHADMDLCFTILDCCCEHTNYLNHFGYLTKELCEKDKSFANILEITFICCYISDSFDSHKSNIIAKYFVHLLRLGLIPCKLWAILRVETTYPETSYSKNFLKNIKEYYRPIL